MNNIGLDEGMESEEEEELNEQTTNARYEALNPFKDLYPNSDIVKAMRQYGPNIVSLSLIGMLMNYTGNHLLAYIYNSFKKKIFFPMHKVTSI
jgi:hypothetical protein